MKNKTKISESREHIVVFGFGVQGSAQALNIRDSGLDVAVCIRPGSKTRKMAIGNNLRVYEDAREAAKKASCAVLLIPDGEQPTLYNDVLAANLSKGAALVFAHGFSIHYEKIIPRPDLDVLLVAPSAHGEMVRLAYLEGKGVPCFLAVSQDATGRARSRALAYAKAISKTGPFIDTTFAEETEIDLFAEQAVLCGGMPELVRAAFDTLVEAGYNPDIAYFSCLREIVAIANLLDRHSIKGMLARISDTAYYGATTRGARIIGDATRRTMKEVLKEIKTGKFAKELESARKNGKVKRNLEHLIEEIHLKYKH